MNLPNPLLTLCKASPKAMGWRLSPIRATRETLLLLVLMLPAAMQAQFTFATNNGALTITGYTGSGGNITIPSATNGMPVTSIGSSAFLLSTNLTGITIPNSVTNIDFQAFTGS